tara:strand:- start:1689 stop:3053 length:1365 start_codon:yes stop_codon:yes gene_type:complete
MYDWSSFSEDKEFADSWRKFLKEANGDDDTDDTGAPDPGKEGEEEPEKPTLSDRIKDTFKAGKSLSAAEMKSVHQKLDKAVLALNKSMQHERDAQVQAEKAVRKAGWKGIPEAAEAFQMDEDNPEDVIKKCGFSFGMESICKGWGRAQKKPEDQKPEGTPSTSDTTGAESLDEKWEMPKALKDAGGMLKKGWQAARAQTEKGHSPEQDAKLAVARQACQAVCIYFKGMFVTKSGRDFFTRGLGISPSQAALGDKLASSFIKKAREDARAQMDMPPGEEPTEETPEEEEKPLDRTGVIKVVKNSATYKTLVNAFGYLIRDENRELAGRLVDSFYGDSADDPQDQEDFERFYAVLRGGPDVGLGDAQQARVAQAIMELMPNNDRKDELLKQSEKAEFKSEQEAKQSLGKIFQRGKEMFPQQEGFEGVELPTKKTTSENVNLKFKNLIKEELLRVKK